MIVTDFSFPLAKFTLFITIIIMIVVDFITIIIIYIISIRAVTGNNATISRRTTALYFGQDEWVYIYIFIIKYSYR